MNSKSWVCYRCKNQNYISSGAGRLKPCPICNFSLILNRYSYDEQGRLVDLDTGKVYEK